MNGYTSGELTLLFHFASFLNGGQFIKERIMLSLEQILHVKRDSFSHLRKGLVTQKSRWQITRVVSLFKNY